MSGRVTCECGKCYWQGAFWVYNLRPRCIPSAGGYCDRCGQQLLPGGELGPTREEREQGQRALAVLEALRAWTGELQHYETYRIEERGSRVVSALNGRDWLGDLELLCGLAPAQEAPDAH